MFSPWRRTGKTDLSVCLQGCDPELLSNDTAREFHLVYEAVLIINPLNTELNPICQ